MTRARELLAAVALASLFGTASAEVERTFANGLRLVIVPAEGDAAAVATAVAVVVAYGAGSRDEPKEAAGCAHLVEHLHAVAVPLPAGVVHESRNDTLLSVVTFGSSVDEADVLALLETEKKRLEEFALREELLDQVRGPVFAEILNAEVSSAPRAWNAAMGLVFGDHGLGRPRVGLKETISRIGTATLSAWHKERYRPDNAVVVISGVRDVPRAVELVERTLGTVARPGTPLPASVPILVEKTGAVRADLEARTLAERQVVFCFRGPTPQTPEEAAFLVLVFELRTRLDRLSSRFARSTEISADPRSLDPAVLVIRGLPAAKTRTSALAEQILLEIEHVRDLGVQDVPGAAARVARQLRALTATPRDVRTRLSGAIDRVVADPLVRRRENLLKHLAALDGEAVLRAAHDLLAKERLKTVFVDVKE